MADDIVFAEITKRFGHQLAVDHASFTAPAGQVTAFLGPNGAGKTTTMRMLVGLTQPTSGVATIGGRRYHELAEPVRTVGAHLEGAGFHPGRRGLDELRLTAAATGLPRRRCDEVLELVGLRDAARKRTGSYSLGMRQRLGLAQALMGDPDVLVLDEPANGLDPEGIRWIRTVLRRLADQGRTVLVSSHLLGEVTQTADRVVVITRGRILGEGRLDDLLASGQAWVRVRSADDAALAGALQRRGATVHPDERGGLRVDDVTPDVVGDVALDRGIALRELTPATAGLEDVFLELTARPEQAAPATERHPSTPPPPPGARDGGGSVGPEPGGAA